jgi:hypothetical protein
MAATSTKISSLKTVFACTFCVVLAAGSATAQTAFTSNAYLRAETKRIRRESAQIKTDYKETHLNPHKASYKKGRSGRKRARTNQDNYQVDANGNAVNAAPVEFTHKRKARRKPTN